MVSSLKVSRLLVVCAGLLALAACSASRPTNYQGLTSASMLTTNPNDKDGHVPFLYAKDGADWSQYTKIVLDPVVIYTGADQQFGDTSDEDKKALAGYMQEQFAKALQTKYALAIKPEPAALRIRVTLTGVETSTPVLSTLTKITPVGLVINSVQTARDKQASMTGSVSYAVEIYDGASDRLLRAYVAKQYPWAEDVTASFGTLDASRSGIRVGADDLLAQLR